MSKKLKKIKIYLQKNYFHQNTNQKPLNLRRVREVLKEEKINYFNISILKLITILSSSDKFIPTE